jgi:ribosome-binding factor A
MSELRVKRVEDQLQREVSELILSGDVKDPRVNSFLSVTRVIVSSDLSQARVFISTFEEGTALQRGVDGLNSAAPYMQGLIGRKLRLRNTVKLHFLADEGIRQGFELTQKMKDL